MPEFLNTKVVTEAEFWRAFHELGSIYFIRDQHRDAIKIGYSRDPWKRLSNLQVGNSSRLELIGVIAAEQAIEGIVHFQLMEGHMDGEWFWDRGVTTQWLMDMTGGQPLLRNVWRLVKGRTFLHTWDEKTKTHTKHYWDDVLKVWDPKLPELK